MVIQTTKQQDQILEILRDALRVHFETHYCDEAYLEIGHEIAELYCDLELLGLSVDEIEELAQDACDGTECPF